jgi:hypothetical protein
MEVENLIVCVNVVNTSIGKVGLNHICCFVGQSKQICIGYLIGAMVSQLSHRLWLQW